MADDKKKKPSREAAKGYALLVAPDGAGSCSHDGVQYDVDDDGLVEVPVAAIRDLADHGFKAV